MGQKKLMWLKTLSDGIQANLRPLKNSNMAKVSIVKWCHNWIFVGGNTFFGLPFDFKINLKALIFQNLGYARNET